MTFIFVLDDENMLPIITGGTVGGISLAVIVIFVLVFLRKYKKKGKQTSLFYFRMHHNN